MILKKNGEKSEKWEGSAIRLWALKGRNERDGERVEDDLDGLVDWISPKPVL